MSWLFAVLGVWLGLTVARAQSSVGYPPLTVLNVDRGLPQAFVSSVVDDDDGFIWISTLGGLARYDGRQILPLYHQATNPASPLNSTITSLSKGKTNELWLIYESGEGSRINTQVGRMNTQTGQSTYFPQLVRALHGLPPARKIHIDRRGDVWGVLLNHGIFHYNVRSAQFTHMSRAAGGRVGSGRYRAGLVSDTVNVLTEDPQGRIWAITPAGLTSIAADEGPLRSVRFRSPLMPLQALALVGAGMQAYVRPDGTILLNTRTALLFIDPTGNSVRSVPFPSPPMADESMLYRHTDGTLYIIVGGRLYRYTEEKGFTPIWQYVAPIETKLNDFLPTSLSIDRSGVLWLGANTKGLFRIDLAAPPLYAYRYQTMFCTDVVRSALGLSLSELFHWPFESLKMPSSYIFRHTYDRQGRIWMGIDNEVGYYDVAARRFTRLAPLQAARSGYTDGFLKGIAVDSAGTAWVVSNAGTPMQYDQTTRRWTQPFGKLAMQANEVVADASALWVTTVSNGLVRFDKTTRRHWSVRFRAHTADRQEDQLMDIHQDRRHPDWLWIGSYQGLLWFNKRTGGFRRFTTAQGLPNNTIYAILSDSNGYLWLTTNRGLCRFHTTTHEVVTFGRSDGLPGEEFNRFHRLTLPDGRLAFGGVDGWVLFQPDAIRPDTTKPVVALTGLTINNEPVDLRGQPTTDAPLMTTLADLPLTHEQNYLTVGFAALRYHQPDRVTYRYQLAGYDDRWTVSRQPTASYTKLPPGQYTLRINAANGLGQWSGQVRELAITIAPPIWASGWAYGFYVAGTLALLLGLVRFRIRRAQEQQTIALREQQANDLRQLDKAKSRFFANVSHELRTPLSLILGPLDSVLANGQLTRRDDQLVQLARRHARQLLVLVSDLLDLTKLEAGKLALYPQPVPLKALLSTQIAGFETYAQQKEITLTGDLPIPAQLTLDLDERKVSQVLTNLLTNALKFTAAGGTVRVLAQYENGQLRVAVSDTGRGISPNDLPHVFDPYFQSQAADAPTEGGTGIGLALCQELVQLMNGSLWVDSEWGKGSTFTLLIPAAERGPIQPTETDQHHDATSLRDQLPDSWPTEVPESAGQPTDTVLVVEDHPDLRTYLTTVLSASLTVKTATNGQEALTTLGAMDTLPALLISDIMMPTMDGFQLLEALKSHPQYRQIPVIMLTARAELADKLRALRLGVDDYLLKPFEQAELTARVTTLLHNQRERAAAFALAAGEGEATIAQEAPAAGPLYTPDELKWLQQLEERTKARLSDFELTTDELAAELAMSRSTFYRMCKRLTGLTPAQYLAEARFRQARLLLETRQVSTVKQVAHQVGLRQVNHFAQLYNQRFGRAPIDYL
ncbi:hybrid sensor histidine kinase/response regulator transcription factor [Fibrella aestuarina]|uniref:hybrid sensor histidine kinase/response regulator transcription factor n=1 Tax=Fibrella aestuarina TaxID=651143 RepID=UPI00059C27C6|nr:ATP-binding protein [Fibrella aestuarina]